MRSERSMPLITCEMRWLLEGPLPEEALRWFDRGRQPAAPAWREDRYLLPGVADMGIKEREGRLEIKGRTAKLGAHAPTTEIEGNAERWCKWTYDAAVAERFRVCHAVVVGKGRVQKHFLLESGEPAQPTAQRDVTRRGFSLELTRIRPGAGGDYWSLGIEAAPDDATLLADLLRALADILQGFPLPLPRSCSKSYPRWLLDQETARRADL
jgi:hypothetical protein